MSDKVSKVSLDTSDYERPLKQLNDIVRAFNSEAERADRIQGLLAANTKRTSTAFLEYQSALKEIAKQEKINAEYKAQHGKLTRELIGNLAQLRAHAKAVTPITSEFKTLNEAVGNIGGRLAQATEKLRAFHDKYSHFQALKGMDFGQNLAANLYDLGAPKDVVEKARKLAEEVKSAYMESFKDPAFQEAIRIDYQAIEAEKVAIHRRQELWQEAAAMAAKQSQVAQTEISNRNLEWQEAVAMAAKQEQLTQTEVSNRNLEWQEAVAMASKKDQLRQTEMSNRRLEWQEASDMAAKKDQLAQTEMSNRRLEWQEASDMAAKKDQLAQTEMSNRRLEWQEASDMAAKKDQLAQTEMSNRRLEWQEAAAMAAKKDQLAQTEMSNRNLEWQEAVAMAAKKEQLAQTEYSNRNLEWQQAANMAAKKDQLAQTEMSNRRLEWQEAAAMAAKQDQIAQTEISNRRLQWEEAARIAAKQDRQRERDEEIRIENRQKEILTTPEFQKLTPENLKYGTTIQLVKHTDELAAAYARTNLRIDQFGDTMDRIRRGDILAIRSYNEVAQALRRVDVAAHQADATIHRFSITTESIARLTLARALTHVFYSATNEMYATWDAANEISKKIAEIQTISQKIPQSIEQWKTQIRNLSVEFALPQEDIGKAIYDTISNQIAEGSQAIDFNRIVAPFAIATASSLTDSLNLISSALNSFNLEATDAEQVAAQLFSTIDLGRVTATDMANTYGRVGTFAKQANIDMAELNGMIAQLTIGGVKFERASTFIINVLNKLAKPTPAFSQFLSEFGANSGVEALDMFGLPGILDRIFEANAGSLDDLAEMVQDIRAIIGYSGLLQDLPQLGQTIDEIANGSMANYERAVKVSMESSSFVVAREGQKIKAQFIDIAGAVLDLLAGLNKFGDSTIGADLHSLFQAGMFAAGIGGAFIGGEGLRRAKFRGAGAQDIATQGLAQFEALREESIKMNWRNQIAQATFNAAQVPTAAAAKAPGLIQAGFVAAPQILAGAVAGYGAVKLLESQMPKIQTAIVDGYRGTVELTDEAKKNFDEIKKKAAETAKSVKAAQKDAVADITKEFSEYTRQGKEDLANYVHEYEKLVELSERRAAAENSMLGGVGDFILNRSKQDVDQLIKSMRRPEDQIAARGTYLASQRGVIGSVIDRDPELANEMFNDWLNEVQSLRGDIYSFANENPGRQGQAANFLTMVDDMANQLISSFAQQQGVSPTGDALQDILNIREGVRLQEERAQEFSDLKKFLENNIEKGVSTWDNMLAAISTLDRNQQDLFAKTFGEGSIAEALNAVLEQQGTNKNTERDKQRGVLGARGLDRIVGFGGELANYLNLDNAGPLKTTNDQLKYMIEQLNLSSNVAGAGALTGAGAGALAGSIFPGIGNLVGAAGGAILGGAAGFFGMEAVQDPKIKELESKRQALVDKVSQWAANAAAAGEVTDEAAEQAKIILQEYNLLAQRVRSELGEQAESRFSNVLGLGRADLYNERLSESNDKISEMVRRATIYSRDDRDQLGALLEPISSKFTLNDLNATAARLRGESAEQVYLNSSQVLLDVDQVNINPNSVNFPMADNPYNAKGGGITGPRGTDTVAAWLTPGEYVVNAKSAAMHRGLLEQINNAQYLASGGHVHRLNNTGSRRFQGSGSVNRLYAPNRFAEITEEDYEELLLGKAKRLNMAELEEWRKSRSHSIMNQGPRQMGITRNGTFIPYMPYKMNQGITRNGAFEAYADSPRQIEARLDDFFMRHATQIADAKERQASKVNPFIAQGISFIDMFRNFSYEPSMMDKLAFMMMKFMSGSGSGSGPRPFSFFGPNDEYMRSTRGFSNGGWVTNGPRKYNMNPVVASSGRAVVNNSTTVNAQIHLTGTGSTESDARAMIRGINREAHRGGLQIIKD